LATPGAFARDPKLVWEWYDWRRQLVALCEPNRAHVVLADWSQRWAGFRLVTQNVDGLHERAGTQGVIRFHGSLWDVKCFQGCERSPERWWDDTVPFPQLPPACPYCDGLLRPGVVWFGEPIDAAVLERSTEAAACELFVVAGTSSVVHPAASLVDLARRSGAFTVEINPEPTPSTGLVDVALQGPAEDVLAELDARL
jgi:NAD-dependent deacetylase